MYNITKIDSLGTSYTIADVGGRVIKMMQIIPYSELQALGDLAGDYTKDGITEYMAKFGSMLGGTELYNPYKVLWYSTHDDEVVLSEVIEGAVKHGYDTIVLEHLDDLDF